MFENDFKYDKNDSKYFKLTLIYALDKIWYTLTLTQSKHTLKHMPHPPTMTLDYSVFGLSLQVFNFGEKNVIFIKSIVFGNSKHYRSYENDFLEMSWRNKLF